MHHADIDEVNTTFTRARTCHLFTEVFLLRLVSTHQEFLLSAMTFKQFFLSVFILFAFFFVIKADIVVADTEHDGTLHSESHSYSSKQPIVVNNPYILQAFFFQRL